VTVLGDVLAVVGSGVVAVARVPGVVTQVSPLLVALAGESAAPALKAAGYSPVVGDAVMVDAVAGIARVVAYKVG